jgi:hypothetical protein
MDPDEGDCWKSGCHGSDFLENSFVIPLTGVPAVAGPGKLTRFRNAFELQDFIYKNMPFFPSGSLTAEETLALTAFILRMNEKQPTNLTLTRANSAAIPIHRKVPVPGRGYAGIIIRGNFPCSSNRVGHQAEKNNPSQKPGVQTEFHTIYLRHTGRKSRFHTLALRRVSSMFS